MTGMRTAVASDELREALIAYLKEHPTTAVGQLLSAVASEQDADIELVAGAMWDLVEHGVLNYGTNAHLTFA